VRPLADPSTDATRGKKAPPIDLTTWETWWELGRLGILARHHAARPAGGAPAKVEGLLDPEEIEARLWPHLLATMKDKDIFVAESALTSLGQVARSESGRAEARKLLLASLGHRNHLLARCGVLGLLHVADDATMDAMAEVALAGKAGEGVRAMILLGLAERGHAGAQAELRRLALDQEAYYELVGVGLAGVGAYPGDDPARAASLLVRIAFETKGVQENRRAVAVGALGRIPRPRLVRAALFRGLEDVSVPVRRAAAVALGVLDDPTSAADTSARLVRVMDHDPDPFARRLAAIGIGRIVARGGPRKALEHLKRHVADKEPGVREFALLALALAGDDGVPALATPALSHENPSTRSAALVALGITGLRGRKDVRLDAKTRAEVRDLVLTSLVKDANPHVRAYAALALGMVGEPGAATAIRKILQPGSSPQEKAYGALGLALTGEPGVAADILQVLTADNARNGLITAHVIYALGLTKDRSAATVDRLIELAGTDQDRYVRAAAVASMGYLTRPERFARRHQLGSTHVYSFAFDYIELWFFML